jgi:glucosamine--fructose-6-phosphate aminotransferase (isomerizing)
VNTPTHFLLDILRQPDEMSRAIDYLSGPGRDTLQQASALVRSSPHVFVTGIGASWNAALSAGFLFQQAGNPVQLQEAAELLHFTTIPGDAVIVAISRTGRSIEIIQLLAKAEASGARVIGITNSEDSPLASGSCIAITIPTKLDHAISVNTYSTLVIAASALAGSATADFSALAPSLVDAIRGAGHRLQSWRAQVNGSSWLKVGASYYFLARGGSLGTCHEARLLWEEGVKMPASAMSTSNFRHGPQEIVRQGMRFCLWIDQSKMRDQDLSVATDLRELGASVMLVGENLPDDAGDLVCQLPKAPANLQFVIDVLPAQLAAERLSRMAGVDCDSFRVCSYVIEDENGLRKKAEVSQNGD